MAWRPGLGVYGPLPRPPPSSGPLLTARPQPPIPAVSQPRPRFYFLRGSQNSPEWPDLLVYVCASIPQLECASSVGGGCGQERTNERMAWGGGRMEEPGLTPGFWSWWPSGQGGLQVGLGDQASNPALAPGPQSLPVPPAGPSLSPPLPPSGGDWRSFSECELWGPRDGGEVGSLHTPHPETPLQGASA
ncbi:hypothetical protein HJG60_007747 [Phyllostomus discolor]|uniref:Uncharacterized protein n=1 Tax=Phyllostomus discolor TaxID=89673 RepID=A0A834BKU0_9CHIR|nr:hypothetical protein HJG60_007747 [Phyllostomus discolor]